MKLGTSPKVCSVSIPTFVEAYVTVCASSNSKSAFGRTENLYLQQHMDDSCLKA
jgi:hypothetical protein